MPFVTVSYPKDELYHPLSADYNELLDTLMETPNERFITPKAVLTKTRSILLPTQDDHANLHGKMLPSGQTVVMNTRTNRVVSFIAADSIELADINSVGHRDDHRTIPRVYDLTGVIKNNAGCKLTIDASMSGDFSPQPNPSTNADFFTDFCGFISRADNQPLTEAYLFQHFYYDAVPSVLHMTGIHTRERYTYWRDDGGPTSAVTDNYSTTGAGTYVNIEISINTDGTGAVCRFRRWKNNSLRIDQTTTYDFENRNFKFFFFSEKFSTSAYHYWNNISVQREVEVSV